MASTSILLGFASTVFFTLTRAQNGVCPCGTQGVNCSLLLDGVDTINNTLEGVCFAASTCTVEDGNAFCDCECGYNGDLCENEVIPKSYNYVVAFLYPILMVLVSFYTIRRREMKTGSTDWDIPSTACTNSKFPSISPKLTLAFRVLVFPFSIGVHLESLVFSISNYGFAGLSLYRAFTIWNWVLLMSYFGIGTYLSIKNQIDQAVSERKRLTMLERVFWMIMEVELPSTFLVFFVVWLVLFPDAKAGGCPECVAYFNSYMVHGANVAFMFIDFFLNGLYFQLGHIFYIVVWGGAYLIFHALYMLGEKLAGNPHCPVYGFLDLGSDALAIWLVGLTLVLCFFFVLAYGTSILKSKCEPGVDEEINHDKAQVALADNDQENSEI